MCVEHLTMFERDLEQCMESWGFFFSSPEVKTTSEISFFFFFFLTYSYKTQFVPEQPYKSKTSVKLCAKVGCKTKPQ